MHMPRPSHPLTPLHILVCAFASLLLIGCGSSYEPVDAKGLAKCYEFEFATPPPPGVTNLKAKNVVVRDAAQVWLRFEADSNIVSQIISNRFTPTESHTFTLEGRGGNTPIWWTPESNALTAFYINKQWRPQSNATSIAVLAHDATKRIVYFTHSFSL